MVYRFFFGKEKRKSERVPPTYPYKPANKKDTQGGNEIHTQPESQKAAAIYVLDFESEEYS